MDQKRGAADLERALEDLFCDENMRLLWGWLGELGVPPHGREEMVHRIFHEGARALSMKSMPPVEPWRLLQRMAVHVVAHCWDEDASEMDPEDEPPGSSPAA